MLSRTKLKLRIKRKTAPELAQAISLALKNPNWMQIAKMLSGSTRKYSSVNLSEISNNSSAGDTIIIPGKVLSKGELTKKIRICALGISAEANEKLKFSKSQFAHIAEEIKKNPKAEGIKIIR